MAEIAPDIGQKEAGVLADLTVPDDLQVGLDGLRELEGAIDIVVNSINTFQLIGECAAVTHQRKDGMPSFGSKPTSFHSTDELPHRGFTELVVPFKQVPFFLGIGNHELIPPKSREQFIQQFADWLNAPALRDQRLADDRTDHRLRTYYHWMQGGIDFLNLDNASPDQFDGNQLAWFQRVIERDAANPAVKTIVVGMHKALPFSISCDHSMNESGEGERSGVNVYQRLLDLENHSHKNVYVLASHSHYFMDGIFNTRYWHDHGGVLPGLIVGTAGAQHYRRPPNYTDARESAELAYGYVLATVHADGTIDFAFKEVKQEDIPNDIREHYGKDWIARGCFKDNQRDDNPVEKDYCAAVAQPVGGPKAP